MPGPNSQGQDAALQAAGQQGRWPRLQSSPRKARILLSSDGATGLLKEEPSHPVSRLRPRPDLSQQTQESSTSRACKNIHLPEKK